MNLVKLLKVGRSLNGEKSLFGKYKMAQQSLPRFASTVRPSRSAPALESLLEKAKSVPTTEPAKLETRETIRRAFVTSVLDKTQKIPAGKILRRLEEPVLKKEKITCFGAVQNKIAAWKKKLAPVRSRKKSGAAPVQTEWALGQVTVARNDLSEADLEIVAPKVTLQPRKAHLPDLTQVKVSGSRWIKKTTRMFRGTSPFAERPEEKASESSEAKAAPELAGKI